MSESQTEFGFDKAYTPSQAVLPELRDEIARIWGLPLGERVEICLRENERSAATGILELVSSPAYPWNPHEPLHLRIAGLPFTSRDIERWTQLD